MEELLQNKPLWTSLLAVGVAQVLKVIIVFIMDKKINISRIKETGGMPSSHSAGVVALATSIALHYGVNSPYFAISAVLATIVIYDAIGIRRAAGKHAEILNDLVNELSDLFEKGFQHEALKTLLGHTIPQVFIGSLLGLVIAYFTYV